MRTAPVFIISICLMGATGLGAQTASPPQKAPAEKSVETKNADTKKKGDAPAKKTEAQKPPVKKAADAPAKKAEPEKKQAEKSKMSSEEKAAREAFAKGQEAFTARDFAQALTHFKKAHSLMKHPGLLFNIAQCKAHLGEHDDAIVLYERYLTEMGDQADVEITEKLIEASRAELRNRKDLSGRETLAAKIEKLQTENADMRLQVEEAEADRGPGWVFWTAVVAGGVFTAAGATAVGLSLYCDGQGAPGLMGCLSPQESP